MDCWVISGDTLLQCSSSGSSNNNKYFHCNSPLDIMSQVEQQCCNNVVTLSQSMSQISWVTTSPMVMEMTRTRWHERHIPHITLRDKTWRWSWRVKRQVTWRNVNMAWPCLASADGHLHLLHSSNSGPPTAKKIGSCSSSKQCSHTVSRTHI